MKSLETEIIPADRVEATLRFPVIMFLSSAVFWLIAGSFLGCLAAWKLVVPSLLDGSAWLTYGRIQPAAENALLYGWASQAGIGLGLWLLARLGRTSLGSERLLVAAGPSGTSACFSVSAAYWLETDTLSGGLNFRGRLPSFS